MKIVSQFTFLYTSDFKPNVNFECFKSVALNKSSKVETLLIKYALIIAMVFLPLSYLAFSLMPLDAPCSTNTFGYFLIPECSLPNEQPDQLSTSSTVLLMLISALTFTFAADEFGSFGIFLAVFSFLQCINLCAYIKQIGNKLTGDASNLKKNLPYYRQLQILGRYYNLIQQDGLVIMTMVILMLAFIVSFYGMIELGSSGTSSAMELAVLAVSGSQAMLFLLLYTTALGKLHVEVSGLCKRIKTQLIPRISDKNDKKWVERYVRSCQPLKCYIGYSGFVDELSPLVVNDFCINQIVTLVLL